MGFPVHSPIQEVQIDLLTEKGVSLWVKRDDLIHPDISGNKSRKLKYNLLQAEKEGQKTLLTFGGAYSNHIAATAFAAKLFGFKSIGIIRGERPKNENATLIKARADGMKLKFVSRREYSQKTEKAFLENLKKEFGDFYCIPEGGANSLAVKGCSEILQEVEMDFDFVCVPCGTGTTLAGIISSLKYDQKALGFPVLKGGGFIENEVRKLLGNEIPADKMELIIDYHFGGYAKIKPELVGFVNWFYSESGIPLDLVYTAKMFYGIFDLLEMGFFPQESKILAVHTGGLQGNIGMLERHNFKLDFC